MMKNLISTNMLLYAELLTFKKLKQLRKLHNPPLLATKMSHDAGVTSTGQLTHIGINLYIEDITAAWWCSG